LEKFSIILGAFLEEFLQNFAKFSEICSISCTKLKPQSGSLLIRFLFSLSASVLSVHSEVLASCANQLAGQLSVGAFAAAASLP